MNELLNRYLLNYYTKEGSYHLHLRLRSSMRPRGGIWPSWSATRYNQYGFLCSQHTENRCLFSGGKPE